MSFTYRHLRAPAGLLLPTYMTYYPYTPLRGDQIKVENLDMWFVSEILCQ